jgi:pimeloyl-ACP methyl ester carboxylesterase
MLPSDRHMGFSSAESLGRLLTLLLWKFWRICGAAILILILIYWMYGGIIILILLVVTVIGGLYHYQDSLLYYPEQPESARVFVQTPSSLGLPYENVCLTTKDGCRIVGYFIKQPAPIMGQTPTVLYFHGNAGNIGHRLHNAQALYRHCGFNIFLLEYRGYGKSQGTPSEFGLYLDAEAALDFLLLRRDIDRRKIILFGRSLGGAVAIYLAASHSHMDKVMALVVENTFTAIPSMAQLMFPLASHFPLLCFKNKFLSNREICRVRTPSLFLSGLSDQLIPSRMMMELYQACSSPVKHIETFQGGTHNGTWTCYGYYDHVNTFTSYLLHNNISSTGDLLTPPDTNVDPGVATTTAHSANLWVNGGPAVSSDSINVDRSLHHPWRDEDK